MNTHTTQTTHCFTLQQLRAATQAGGVAGVSLKAQGSGFFIQIQLRTGQNAVLVTARSRSPRMFKNPAQAFGVLKRVGIVTGSFDVTHYAPEQQQTSNDSKQKEKNSAPTLSKTVRTPKAAPAPSAASAVALPPSAPAAPVTPPAPAQPPIMAEPRPTTVSAPTPTPAATSIAPKKPPKPAPQLATEPENAQLSLGVQQSLI